MTAFHAIVKKPAVHQTTPFLPFVPLWYHLLNQTRGHPHDMISFPIRTVALAIAILGVGGCAEGKQPFRMVQFCLEHAGEITAFTTFMREISDEHQMRFYDRSKDTYQELTSLAADNEKVPLNDQTVNIGARHGDDFSFGAGNLGMPTDQIVIGFNGDDLKAAHAFADATVEKLSGRWKVKEVASGKGAFPLTNCD
ncbi:hypothetical protein [Blastomonas sp.]|uniref:hypothetical protein n=1 Tax=Blastomonas sp. TaxID=1909299 RepID=UPI00391D9E10